MKLFKTHPQNLSHGITVLLMIDLLGNAQAYEGSSTGPFMHHIPTLDFQYKCDSRHLAT